MLALAYLSDPKWVSSALVHHAAEPGKTAERQEGAVRQAQLNRGAHALSISSTGLVARRLQ